MNFVFLVDPIEEFIIKKDTSFALMLAAQRANHQVFTVYTGDITLSGAKVLFHCQRLTAQDKAEQPFVDIEKVILDQDEIDVIFIRTDPPFDNSYVTNTWLLDIIADRVLVINHPSGVRTVNEKIWASQFADLVPPTLITCKEKEFKSFLAAHKQIILKPTDGFGGAAIFKLSQGDTNTNVAFETISKDESEYVIVQKYISAAEEGDKRILLLEGEILGALMRVHSSSDHRNNFSKGATAAKAELTDRDLEIVAVLKPHLQKMNLDFVGIDIIGDYLIEVNVTSPTTIRELGRLYDKTFEDEIVQFAEQKAKKMAR